MDHMGHVRGLLGFNTVNMAIPTAVQNAVPTVDIARQDKLFVVSNSKHSDGITARISDAFGNSVSDSACPFKPENAIPDKSIIIALSGCTSSSSLRFGGGMREGNVAVSISIAIVLSLVFDGVKLRRREIDDDFDDDNVKDVTIVRKGLVRAILRTHAAIIVLMMAQ